MSLNTYRTSLKCMSWGLCSKPASLHDGLDPTDLGTCFSHFIHMASLSLFLHLGESYDCYWTKANTRLRVWHMFGIENVYLESFLSRWFRPETWLSTQALGRFLERRRPGGHLVTVKWKTNSEGIWTPFLASTLRFPGSLPKHRFSPPHAGVSLEVISWQKCGLRIWLIIRTDSLRARRRLSYLIFPQPSHLQLDFSSLEF